MRKTLLILLMAAAQTMLWAVPAKRGVWRDIKLENGTTIRAELRGDEYASYWRAEDGRCFVRDAQRDTYVLTDLRTIQARNTEARAKAPALAPARVSIGGSHPAYIGSKRGLIILAEFTDCKFQPEHTNEFYTRMANEPGFSEGDFVGSIHDYFWAQSEQQFDLTFDVVGPIQLKKNVAYYGAHDGNAHDVNAGAMIYEAVNEAVKLQPSFAAYDWFGDGYVDQVFVLYAGGGEADGGGDDTIWPHRSSFGYPYTIGGKKVQTYACANELRGDGKVDGIGAFCHEFSHCLGLADLYDTSGGDNYGMGSWDLMDGGCYLGGSYRPCAYSGYARNYCGWKTPKILTDDCEVTDLKGISEDGDYYIIYNDAHPDEYYILENRTQTGWDAALYGSGLLITHIDFKKSAWSNNQVNATAGHERYAMFLADNSTSGSSYADIAGDLYPCKTNSWLSNKSVPAATLYNPNPDGEKFMSKPITRIRRADDGTISFTFRNQVGQRPEPLPEGMLFRETFDECYGQGGNDGRWTTTVADVFIADNDGWTSAYMYGADRCARFGTNAQRGLVTTPEIEIDGEAELMFRAAPWTGEAASVTLSVTSGSATLSQTSFSLTKGQWTEHKATLKGTGKVKVQFRANRARFFLDEVCVVTDQYDGIAITPAATSHCPYTYNLMGQPVDPATYRGIVIRDGKKLIRK